MIAKLLISMDLENRVREIKKILSDLNLSPNHPDLLYFAFDSKLGVESAKKIKEHFSLKPYSAKGRAVVLEDGGDLTPEAQNALLKTIEELPKEALFIIGADSDSKFLPTVLSRCQIVILRNEMTKDLFKSDSSPAKPDQNDKYSEDIEKLLAATLEERFGYIEKLKEKEEFLHALVKYFHQILASHSSSGNVEFLKELLQAEQWAKQNVNIRAILEYLMLVIPRLD